MSEQHTAQDELFVERERAIITQRVIDEVEYRSGVRLSDMSTLRNNVEHLQESMDKTEVKVGLILDRVSQARGGIAVLVFVYGAIVAALGYFGLK